MLMENQARRTRKTEQSERPVEPLPEPASDSPPTVLALIERVALDLHADVEKLDRMMTMYERFKAKEAELAFNGAKGRILKKLAGIKIVKNRPVLSDIDNGKQRGAVEAFKYAPLEEIDKHLRPLLAEEQMDLSYSDEPCDGGGILVRGRLKHLPGGYYEDSFMPAPPDTTGGKSNVQAVGSTNSFLRRYVACNIFNIVVVGDDDDGTGGTIDEAQAKTILELIKKAKVGLAGSSGGDDRRPRLSQGRQHARGADRQGRGRSCPSFMMWRNTRKPMTASSSASRRAPISTRSSHRKATHRSSGVNTRAC